MDIFINSFIAGITQTMIGHPFDTVKTIKQMYPHKYEIKIISDIYKTKGPLYFYRGYFYPLIGGCFQNSFIFTLENKFDKYFKNTFYSGFISGGISGVIMTPAEYIKCNMQLNKNLNYYSFNFKNCYKGLYLTFLRDSFGFSIYFSSYKYFKNINDNPLINGGLAGVFSWIYSYPIDTIKTKYQASNNSIFDIINKTSYFELTAGMKVMLIRSFCVNSAIFYTFDYLNSKN